MCLCHRQCCVLRQCRVVFWEADDPGRVDARRPPACHKSQPRGDMVMSMADVAYKRICHVSRVWASEYFISADGFINSYIDVVRIVTLLIEYRRRSEGETRED